MGNNQIEKLSHFFRYIYCNNISVLLTDFDKTKQIKSVLEFEFILKEKAGNHFACVLDECNYKILIYDECCKVYIGYVCGTVEYGYSRRTISKRVDCDK